MFDVRKLLALLLLTLGSSAIANENEPPPPLDPEYMGSHDMILVSKATTLFAYPIPGYEKPHNQQIIYKISTKANSLNFLVRDAELVTARSQPFNLERLIRGEELDVTLDVYMGHFDRGGLKMHEQIVVTFEELKYHRDFNEIEPSSIRQVYDSVKVGSNEYILVHRLQETPTYDNLILFDDMVSCVTDFTTSTPIPDIVQIYNRLHLCGPMKPLYYETQLYQ